MDILVNNAQGYRHALLADATDDDMDVVWRTGPPASFRSMKAAYPYLKQSQGLIVNFGSGTQFDPVEKFHATYNAAKARSHREEYAVMPRFARREVEEAFAHNWETGCVKEDQLGLTR